MITCLRNCVPRASYNAHAHFHSYCRVLTYISAVNAPSYFPEITSHTLVLPRDRFTTVATRILLFPFVRKNSAGCPQDCPKRTFTYLAAENFSPGSFEIGRDAVRNVLLHRYFGILPNNYYLFTFYTEPCLLSKRSEGTTYELMENSTVVVPGTILKHGTKVNLVCERYYRPRGNTGTFECSKGRWEPGLSDCEGGK